jgi:hypothetical protein
MRGWMSVFARERNLQRYRKGVFVATAEPELIRKVLPVLKEEFPNLEFTFVGPRAYQEVFQSSGKSLWLEDLKLSPLQALTDLRKQHFDVAAVVLAGRPTFFKPKLMAFLLNPARFVVFNENADSFAFDRSHWKAAWSQVFRRSRFSHPGPVLFIPFGFLYLLFRVLHLSFSGRLHRSQSRRQIDVAT